MTDDKELRETIEDISPAENFDTWEEFEKNLKYEFDEKYGVVGRYSSGVEKNARDLWEEMIDREEQMREELLQDYYDETDEIEETGEQDEQDIDDLEEQMREELLQQEKPKPKEKPKEVKLTKTQETNIKNVVQNEDLTKREVSIRTLEIVNKPFSLKQFYDETGMVKSTARRELGQAVKRGELKRISRGVYQRI